MDDRVLGTLIMIGSLTALAVYGALLLGGQSTALLVIKTTAFLADSLILAIFAWIGYTLVTTPPPTPLEESFEDQTTPEG